MSSSPSVSRSGSDSSLIYDEKSSSVPSTFLGKHKVKLIGAVVGAVLGVAAIAILFFVPGMPCVDVSSAYGALAMVGGGVGGAALGTGIAITADNYWTSRQSNRIAKGAAFQKDGSDLYLERRNAILAELERDGCDYVDAIRIAYNKMRSN